MNEIIIQEGNKQMEMTKAGQDKFQVLDDDISGNK